MKILENPVTATSTVRMSLKDAHFGGGRVAGATLLHLVGDVATELAIKYDGDEGLLLKYNNIEFLDSIYAGDYIRVDGKLTEVGNTSRKMVFAAYKTGELRPDVNPSAADSFDEPKLVLRAELIGVTKEELKRKNK